MKIKLLTNGALERIVVCFKFMVLLFTLRNLNLLRRIHHGLLGENEAIEGFGAWIEIVPDVAKLGDWAKDRPFQFVNVMWKSVWTCYKLWLWFIVDLELYLADNQVIKLDVNQNVICAFPQSIFYSYNLHFLGVSCTHIIYFFVNFNDFLLFRWAFTTH